MATETANDDRREGTSQRFIRAVDAARRCGVSRRTLNRWLASGLLRRYRPTRGGVVLLEIAEVDALILSAAK